MRALVRERGLEDRIEVDSAGTGAWHVGNPPDRRATEAARRRGVTLEGRARRFEAGDFDRFDLILAMDSENLRDLRALAPDAEAREKVRLLRGPGLDVPDPYYGGDDGFALVLDQVEQACRALLDEIA